MTTKPASWTAKDDDALFEFHQEVGTNRKEYNYLTRAWTDKRKHHELSAYRRYRTRLIARQSKIAEAVRILKLVRLSQPEKDTTLVRLRVKLTPKQWNDLEVESTLDSECFITRDEVVTVVKTYQDDTGADRKKTEQYVVGTFQFLESGLSDHVKEGMDEDIVQDFDKYLHRTTAVGYPPVSAAISRIVYPAMLAKLNVEPTASTPGLSEREIHLTSPEIKYLRRKGTKKMSAVLRTLLDRHLSA